MISLVNGIKHLGKIQNHYYTISLRKEERIHPYSFYEVSITLILKPEKDITKKKLQINIPQKR